LAQSQKGLCWRCQRLIRPCGKDSQHAFILL
jgi:hypothetical protein